MFKVRGSALGFGVFRILRFCVLRRRARRFRSIAAGGARVVRVFRRLVRRARASTFVFYRLARRASAFACSTAWPVTRAPPRQSRARRGLRVLPRCKPAVAYSAASPGARASTFACSTASRAYSTASPGARLFYRAARVVEAQSLKVQAPIGLGASRGSQVEARSRVSGFQTQASGLASRKHVWKKGRVQG